MKGILNPAIRINILIVGFLIVCIIFVLRLFSIQVLGHSKYKEQAQSQYWDITKITSNRGNILAHDGYALASNQPVYLVFSENKNIKNPSEIALKIAKIIGKDDSQVLELSEKYKNILNLDVYWAILIPKVNQTQKEEIERLNISGIGFEEQSQRFYPEDTLASHVLGYVAKDENGESRGYFGLEGYFDGDLTGKEGRIVQEKDASGVPIIAGGYKKVPSIDGRDLHTTINRDIQFIVERKLKEGVIKYNALSGTVIIMDPFTGDVVAMANYPTFNPLEFYKEALQSTDSERIETNTVNYAISRIYEPGSVIKALTVAAAIDLKKVSPQTTFEDNGPVNYSGYIIDNWDGKHYGTQTIIELLQKSNNIGAAWVGKLVGRNKLYKYFKDFGLSEPTQISLEGEESGILRDYKTWTDIDLANISFGQGVSATPLQVLNSFNVIANGGYLVRPRIVSKLIEKDKVIEIPPNRVRRVISLESANIMTAILDKAVEGGESRYFNIKNYKISGKTGTAQIFVNGKYDAQKTNATFVGYLTTSKKFSMIVKLEQPTTSTFASETAVPLWMEIADELVKYYNILPDSM